MTEQEFQSQVWRMHDRITTNDGVPGKVIGVSFTTKSVRALVSGAPEWLRYELLETHTTGKGADGSEASVLDELRCKVLRADERIHKLENEKMQLQEKIEKNHLGGLLQAVHVLQQALQEKKNKMEQIDIGLGKLQDALEKMEKEA